MAGQRNYASSIGDEAIYLRIEQLRKGLLQFTDSTNADRLVKEFGKDIRYIAPWKKWIVWTGNRWEVDNGSLIHAKGLMMVRNIYAELYKTADYRDRLDIEKYAIQSESVRRREAFVKAASWIPFLNAHVDDLDRNTWLLNVENGSIDLKTGELLPHRQEDMITKIAGVQYDRGADCPRWKQFIREIMGYKPELIDERSEVATVLARA
jgi:putative DNA primase/helicase